MAILFTCLLYVFVSSATMQKNRSSVEHMDYQQIIADLRIAYSSERARARDQAEKENWKVTERQQFLDLLWYSGAGNRHELEP
jgi:hypothetical protein